ncbi:HD domain-containing protein [Amycolatopsis anabasis]|uniref:HD domain-containing protein n=1 Tax=Amycolatopsis anabasis TaxID=1840409 RepID=UPI001FE86DD2|nr:HD domain-containing protein [Amycolatopsis anabasis]
MRTWARALAQEHLLGALPRRWRHVDAVAARAHRIRRAFEPDGDLLVAAAYLHDIGYAPGIVDTGFHPLDGARYLRALGAPPRLVGLVAHHSLAAADAEAVGLTGELAEFADERTPVRDALWYCDFTTGPDGQSMTVAERIREVCARYGRDDPKCRIRLATARERMAVAWKTRKRLSEAGIIPPRGRAAP